MEYACKSAGVELQDGLKVLLGIVNINKKNIRLHWRR